MKKLFTLLFTLSTALCNAQTFAKGIGGVLSDQGLSVAVDATGNIYTTGYFMSIVDFDPGAGTANLSAGISSDIFISKLNTAGNYVWAKSIGPSIISGSSNRGNSIVTDAAGNVYITGYFAGTSDFDPGAGTSNLISDGSNDIFILKLDASGNYVWAKGIAGSGNDRGYSVAVDALGNVYTTGYFSGTVDFDPGAGTANLVSIGASDIFVSKLDAVGNYVWAKNMGGSGASVAATSIAIDAASNVYTTGYFTSTVDFDPGASSANLVSSGSVDMFISKLDAAGNYIWAKRIGGTGNDAGNSITIDATGNVYTTGQFNVTVDFDPGAGIANLSSAGSDDIFVLRLDAAGNYVWAKGMGGTGMDAASAIVTDASGNVAITGVFQGTADFDPGAGTINLISVGGGVDIFVSKLDAAGNYVWANGLGGTLSDWGSGIATDATGNVYTTGTFQGTADFDPSAATLNLTSLGALDIFVSKLNPSGILPLHLINFSGAVVNNANTLQWKTADEVNTKEFILERSTDGSSFTSIAAIAAKGFGNGLYVHNDAGIFTGKLYYRLKMVDIDGKFSYSNIISLTTQQNNKISVYPNPAKDLITVQTSDNKLQGTQIILTDLSGKTLYKKTITSTFEILNVKTLPKGMYLINFADGSFQKLIKE